MFFVLFVWVVALLLLTLLLNLFLFVAKRCVRNFKVGNT